MSPERYVLRQLCALPVTPERLNMIITLFDPNQFGGRFFGPIGSRLTTIFRDLSILESKNPRNGIPVQERFDNFQRIIRCLANDLKMPVHLDEYYSRPATRVPDLHLMDLVRHDGRSWIAFTVFLEYFPELTDGKAHILSARYNRCEMFLRGHHINADLPFILDKLLPYSPLADLLEAKTQFEYTKWEIDTYYSTTNEYDPTVIQTLSDMLDQAIITKLKSSPLPPASLN